MKILFIITRADTLGGAQVHVRDTAHYLLQQGHQVKVVTGVEGFYNQILTELDIPNVPCANFNKKIKPYRDGKTLSQLTQLIQDYQPDLVSTHSSKAGILGRIACRLTQTPCIFTAHGWAFTEGVPEPKRSFYRKLELIAAPLATRIICVSEHDRKIGIAAGMNPNQLVTIHNGMPEITEHLLAQPSFNHSVSIIMVARFDRQKDHETLLRAVQNLSEVKITLIGDGPKLEQMQALAETLKIRNRVNFIGFSSQVAEYLAKADIFALISNWEGFPRTIIEAMRASLPVIATNVGGVSESVIDRETGFCIPPRNVKVLEEKISYLIRNPQIRHEMGKAGRESYEKKFTFQSMFSKTFNLYQEVLSEATLQ